MKTRLQLLTLALTQLLCAAALAEGEIWVWTTADGSVHYTDELGHVPEAFRESARVAHKEGGGSYQRVLGAAPASGEQPTTPAEAPIAAADGDAAAEASWRDQARAIDDRIAALAPKVEACKTDHINRSPGDGSRKRREEREEASACEQARQDLATAQADRQALEERAQRADVPPGWVRRED